MLLPYNLGTVHVDLEQAILSRNTAQIQALLTLINREIGIDALPPYIPYLMIAVESNNIEILRLLLEAGFKIDTIDDDGWSALMFAVLENNIAMVRVLVEAGADVNIESPTGEFALEIALDNDYAQLIDYLYPLTNLKLKQNLDIRDRF
ncbi:MAG: ankyrin repeat domain-containing protein [Cyanobacteria bacterium P01_E01_bin.42]